MNRRLFLTLLGAFAARGNSAGADPDADKDADEDPYKDADRDRPELSARELMQFTPIAEGVSHASALVLYEGLPRPGWEDEQFKTELATRKTVRFHDYPFYAKPLPVSADEIEPLRRLSAAADTYWSYSGPKFCGGYHPDYCLRWKGVDATFDLLICFSCHEMKLYSPGRMLLVDIRENRFRQFEATLTKYRNGRRNSHE